VQHNTIINQTNVNVTNVNVTNVNVYQNTVVHNGPMVVPASQLATAKKINTVTLDPAARMQAQQQAQAVQQVAVQRLHMEKAVPAGAPNQPRVATLNVPPHEPFHPAAVANRPVAPTTPAVTPKPGVTNAGVPPPRPGTPTTPAGSAAPATARMPMVPPGAKPATLLAPQHPVPPRVQPKPGQKDKDKKDKDKDKDKQPPK
jgi:hypothetical protein